MHSGIPACAHTHAHTELQTLSHYATDAARAQSAKRQRQRGMHECRSAVFQSVCFVAARFDLYV
eukprot:1067049-Alexandrium_andersonii.AAC.1